MRRRRPIAPRSAPRRFALGAVSLIAALGVATCRSTDGTAPAPVERTEWPVQENDPGDACADVGEQRACWSGRTARDVQLTRRAVPPVKPSPLGFRCRGSSDAVRCVDRARDALPFRCEGATCRQRGPRMPDDGEWECADLAGIVVCHGGLAAAGVPPGGSDGGYVCGPRGGTEGAPGERICIDLSPDFPEGHAEGLRCRFETDGTVFRVCSADPSARSAGDVCTPSRSCDDGLVCAGGRCLPRRPEPRCWLDRDCDKGTCRFGTCLEPGP